MTFIWQIIVRQVLVLAQENLWDHSSIHLHPGILLPSPHPAAPFTTLTPSASPSTPPFTPPSTPPSPCSSFPALELPHPVHWKSWTYLNYSSSTAKLSGMEVTKGLYETGIFWRRPAASCNSRGRCAAAASDAAVRQPCGLFAVLGAENMAACGLKPQCGL